MIVRNVYGKKIGEFDISPGADLRRANLYEADLYGANLSEANLYGANLSEANLCGANLSEANLCGASLSGANLCGANLCGANLRGASLSGANLYGANLYGAKVAGVLWPAPTMVLLAQWGRVSKELTIELMRYDASNHPRPELFDGWAKGGACPYDDFNFERCANFKEVCHLYEPGSAKSALWLAQELIRECCDLEPPE